MYMSSVTKTTLVVVAALTLVPSAYAGGAPKGKPFIQLGNQIIELQGQMEQTIQQQAEQLTTVAATAVKVDALEETVGTLEDRVLSLEDRVSTAEENLLLLKTKATNQENQINELISGALAHGVDILALQADLATVNQQIDILETDVGVHTDQIAVLQAKATSLTALIETNALGLFALQGELATTNDLIDALEAQLAQLQLVLEMKQHIINHTCPSNQAFISVQPDGSVVCGPVGGVSGLVTLTVFKTHTFPNTPTSIPSHNYACPDGSTIASGSFLKVSANAKAMSASIPAANNSWLFQVEGTNPPTTYQLFLQCIKLLP